MNSIEEIDAKIGELQFTKYKLQQDQKKKEIEEFCKLEWTKNTHITLDINSCEALGFPTYRLRIAHVKNWFQKGLPTTKLFRLNNDICFDTDYNNHPYIYTDNAQALIKFLTENKFASISYNKDHLAALEFVKGLSDET